MYSEEDEFSDVNTITQYVISTIARQDPGNSYRFGNNHHWVNTIQTNFISSTNNNQHFEKMVEHINFISLFLREMKSHILVESQVNETTLNNVYIRDYLNIYDKPLISKLCGMLSRSNPDITLDQINNLVVENSLNVTESNYIDILIILFKAFNTFS